ncbi:hypothetical protein NFI96_028626 [Prochilodus magdalenae]|nr:hypothetical protein NFI96_028626 [Prochilodus magdalenae]
MDRSSRQEEQELFKLQTTQTSTGRRSSVERLWTELLKPTPKDGGAAEASILEAIQRIKESERNTDSEETRLTEVEVILKNIISMSCKYSQSEAALFQAPSLDSVQPIYQSAVTVEDIWRSNGFCLANTETILYDACLSKERENSHSVLPAKYSSQVLKRTHTGQEELATLNSDVSEIRESNHTATTPQSYVNNLSFLTVDICETDILE